MTDEELKELIASLAIKSDRLDAQMQKTDEKLSRIGDMLDGIGKNQGAVAEEFFVNSLLDGECKSFRVNKF